MLIVALATNGVPRWIMVMSCSTAAMVVMMPNMTTLALNQWVGLAGLRHQPLVLLPWLRRVGCSHRSSNRDNGNALGHWLLRLHDRRCVGSDGHDPQKR